MHSVMQAANTTTMRWAGWQTRRWSRQVGERAATYSVKQMDYVEREGREGIGSRHAHGFYIVKTNSIFSSC